MPIRVPVPAHPALVSTRTAGLQLLPDVIAYEDIHEKYAEAVEKHRRATAATARLSIPTRRS